MVDRRLIDELFEAHAHAVAMRRLHGERSPEFVGAQEVVAELRRPRAEERLLEP